jgi:hypothetical protein
LLDFSLPTAQFDEISHTSKVELVAFPDLARKLINREHALLEATGRIDQLYDCMLVIYLVDHAVR